MSLQMFNAWCAATKTPAHPAAPLAVVSFIEQVSHIGINKVLEIVDEISFAHRGVPDPTLSPLVASAVNALDPISPPRSWPKDHWPIFNALPHRLKQYLAGHDKQRELVIRRAQNEAADAKRALREHLEQKETT